MALYDNSNTLLKLLGGPQYAQQNDPSQITQDQIAAIKDFGQKSLDTKLPSTIYSPWQGVSYLLDKFQGRNEIDRANNDQKSILLNALAGLPTSNPNIAPTFGASPTSDQGGTPQPQQTQQPQQPGPTLQQANASKAPIAVQPPSPNNGGNTVLGDMSTKGVYQLPSGQQVILNATDEKPDGAKLISIMDKDGNEKPVTGNQPQQTAQAAPVAPAQASPQPATDTTGTLAQGSPSPNVGQQPGSQGGLEQTGSLNPLQPKGDAPFQDKFPPPPPPMSSNELYHLSQLPPALQQQYLSARTARFTPQTYKTELGTHWVLPNGQSGFINEPKYDTTKIGDLTIPTRTAINPQTGEAETRFQIPGQGGGKSSWGTIEQLQNWQGDVAAGNSQKKAVADNAAKIWEKPVQDAIDAGTAATTVKNQIHTLQQIQNTGKGLSDVSTGPYAQQIMDIKKAVNNAVPGTFDSEGLAKGETIGKINTQIARMYAKQLTNRPTQFDFRTFLANTPNLENTPQGQKTLASLYEAMASQDEAIGQLATKMAGNPQGFAQAKSEYLTAHPVSIQYNGKNLSFAYDKPVMVDGKPLTDAEVAKQGEQSTQPEQSSAPKSPTYNPLTKKWETK